MGSGLLKEDQLSREELRRATIEGTIPTAISDSGAFTTCLQPIEEQAQESECGRYKWDPPFISTGEKSSKVFQMARGDTAPGAEVVQLQGLPLRQEAATGHTVSGLMNNLASMSTLTRNGYVPIFEADKMSI